MAKKGSKNNISNRGKGALLRSWNGKEVEPIMYFSDGKRLMVAKYKESGEIARNVFGSPVLYKESDEPLAAVA